MHMYCSVCGNSFDISRSDAKATHPALDVFCGLRCLMYRVTRGGSGYTIPTVPKPSWMCGFLGRRSTYEETAERFFGYYGLRLSYEPFAIRLEDGSRYIPDFYSQKFNLLFEIKGKWANNGKRKLSSVLSVLPPGSLILIPTHNIKQMEIKCKKYPVFQE